MSNKLNYISARELKQLSQLQPWKVVAALTFDWAVIFAAIIISEWSQSWLVWLLAAAIIGGRMHALSGLIHDFAHYRFINNKAASDWVGDLFLAWPILATIDGYRRNHLPHHRYLNTDKDPDWSIKLGSREFTFPQEMRFSILNLLGYFVALSSLRDMKSMLTRIKSDDLFDRRYKLLRVLYFVIIATAFTITGTWKQYFLYWFIPSFTLFFLFLYIRSVADHFGPTMDHSKLLKSSRTLLPYWWERIFFCPHHLNFHLDHHLYPSVPFFNLPKLNKILMSNDEFAKNAHLTRGYVTGLFREVWSDHWAEAAAKKSAAPQG
ncbi:MAG: fatty acid desaturase family protein [Rhizobiaceae bacterium]|nr:fatty acid desaturase family protein [Rhizobiaceae bacterium]